MDTIFSVYFHVKAARKVHIFWFTDEKKAVAFLESVKNYPKVVDAAFVRTPANVTTEYDGIVEEGETDFEWII